MARQIPNRPDGTNPLIYTGTVPSMSLMNRRPTVQDGFSWDLGYWWIIPIDDNFPDGETWVLISKANNINTWRRIGDHMPAPEHTGLIYVGKVNGSNESSFDFDSTFFTTESDQFMFYLNNVDADKDCVLNIQFSSDGGNTFFNSSSCGLTIFNALTGAVTVQNSTNGACPVIPILNQAATGGGSAQIYVSVTGITPHLNGNGTGSDAAGAANYLVGGVYSIPASRFNFIRFSMTNGAVMSGIISMYRFKLIV
jgi:hypothetical protein